MLFQFDNIIGHYREQHVIKPPYNSQLEAAILKVQ